MLADTLRSTTLDALPANSAKSNLKLALKTATGPAAAALLDALTSSQLDVKRCVFR